VSVAFDALSSPSIDAGEQKGEQSLLRNLKKQHFRECQTKSVLKTGTSKTKACCEEWLVLTRILFLPENGNESYGKEETVLVQGKFKSGIVVS